MSNVHLLDHAPFHYSLPTPTQPQRWDPARTHLFFSMGLPLPTPNSAARSPGPSWGVIIFLGEGRDLKSEFKVLIGLKWRRYKVFFLISCLAHGVFCGQMSVHGMGWSFLDCTIAGAGGGVLSAERKNAKEYTKKPRKKRTETQLPGPSWDMSFPSYSGLWVTPFPLQNTPLFNFREQLCLLATKITFS